MKCLSANEEELSKGIVLEEQHCVRRRWGKAGDEIFAEVEELILDVGGELIDG